MIHIYTGNGKGKTSAAVGMVMRAYGYGRRVAFLQFMKGRDTGEIKALRSLQGILVEQFGSSNFVNLSSPDSEAKEYAQKGVERALDLIRQDCPDLVVLDEFNVALSAGLIDQDAALSLIDRFPDDKLLILTGRYAPQYLIDLADLVTEMKEIKHPFQKGIPAKEGIDY